MDPVAQFLVAIAGIFLLGALGEIVFRRTSVPDVVWLIGAGLLLGPISGLVSREALSRIAPFFAALTLVVVLFEGGSQLRIAELRRAAPRATLLALATFSLAVLVTAPTTMLAAAMGLLPPEWTWKHGVLVGTILGGSSSIIIMPAMAQARVAPTVAGLVGLESALTDALCVVGASAMIDVIVNAQSSGGGAAGPLLSLARSFAIGGGIGAAAGFLWMLFLRLLRSSEHAYPVTLAGLLLLYVTVQAAGGSAALGILAFAVVVGNAPMLARVIGLAEPVSLGSEVQGTHHQVTFFIKSFFFTFIGLMLAPPWSLLALGLLLGLLLFGARIPGVWLATRRSGFDAGEQRLIVSALPRGMAAGVLATLPAAAGVPGTDELPVPVFAAVLTTIVLFAVGFPLARRRALPAAAGTASPRPAPVETALAAPAAPATAAPAAPAASVEVAPTAPPPAAPPPAAPAASVEGAPDAPPPDAPPPDAPAASVEAAPATPASGETGPSRP